MSEYWIRLVLEPGSQLQDIVKRELLVEVRLPEHFTGDDAQFAGRHIAQHFQTDIKCVAWEAILGIHEAMKEGKKKNQYKADPGLIFLQIEHSLRPLLKVLTDNLWVLAGRAGNEKHKALHATAIVLLNNKVWGPRTYERAHLLVHKDIVDALNEYAPEGHYFGLKVNSEVEWGFWPVEREEPTL